MNRYHKIIIKVISIIFIMCNLSACGGGGGGSGSGDSESKTEATDCTFGQSTIGRCQL